MPGPRENVFHVVLAEPDISTFGVSNSIQPTPGPLHTETTFNWLLAARSKAGPASESLFFNSLRYRYHAGVAVSSKIFSRRLAIAIQ